MHVMGFQKELKDWGRENFRPFPWRLTHDPYHILMAEVMLHRTQAAQVIEVYKEFVHRYPDVQTLARSDNEELEANLYSLGLRWRIRLIRSLASEIMIRFDGRVPESKNDLVSLPGISDYIASAVRCFAWNLPEPLVDTNTVRVVGRLYGLQTRDSSRRNRRFRSLIADLVDQHEPRLYNYALLDLADKVCMKKQSPAHNVCPVLPFCVRGTLDLRGEPQTDEKVETKVHC